MHAQQMYILGVVAHGAPFLTWDTGTNDIQQGEAALRRKSYVYYQPGCVFLYVPQFSHLPNGPQQRKHYMSVLSRIGLRDLGALPSGLNAHSMASKAK